MHMVLEQLNLYLKMDQIYVERYPEYEAKSFFKKCRAFILSNLKSDEIRELMLSFRDTKWYHIGWQTGLAGDYSLIATDQSL